MDLAASLLGLSALRSDHKDRPETFDPNTSHPHRSIVAMAVGIAFGVGAAYLSWTCNAKMGYGLLARILSAFVAYLFGFVYILMYGIFRWDVCRKR
jgi:hypothetical protein